ncbi:MAG TPA: hypothetical protein VMM18_06090 [Gemmatimonadaceae bacterium]|nr:hypothetical protein [Gemmatimonadaceae bacterium]
MKRVALAVLTALLLLPEPAQAQESPAQVAYQQRREQLLRELEQTQQQLASLRSDRVQLAARVEAVIAQLLEQRAQALLMSEEQAALQRLDSLLTASQDNLLAQRDRFLALGRAVRGRVGSALVVLLRADTTELQNLQSADLTVNGAPIQTRTYTVAMNQYLRMGAVDQLFRSDVLPTPHTLALSVVVDGQTRSETLTVNVARETVTYVQFAVRNGQLVSTTWTSRGTTPF